MKSEKEGEGEVNLKKMGSFLLLFFVLCGFRRQGHTQMAVCNPSQTMRIRYQNDFYNGKCGHALQSSSFSAFLLFWKELLTQKMNGGVSECRVSN